MILFSLFFVVILIIYGINGQVICFLMLIYDVDFVGDNLSWIHFNFYSQGDQLKMNYFIISLVLQLLYTILLVLMN
jgi:hypothetical protein